MEAFSTVGNQLLPPPDLIRPTAGNRFAIGTIVGLCLTIGLKESIAAILAFVPAEWASGALVALVISTAVRTVGAVVGGLLAGAGRPSGFVTGGVAGLAIVGLLHIEDVIAETPIGLWNVGQIAVLALLAAVAGRIGGKIWPPVFELPGALPNPRGSSIARLKDMELEERKETTRPTLWLRLVPAIALAVIGTMMADSTRLAIKRSMGGTLNVGGPAQAPMVDLEIAGLGLVIAGLFAGSNTGAGLRHGVILGFCSAMILTVMAAGVVPSLYPIIEGTLLLLDYPTSEITTFRGRAIFFALVFTLCIFGGWLGGVFVPILAPPHMRIRKYHQS